MRRLWQIPAVGERMRVYQLARFYRTLGMLLSGGIAIVQAMTMVAELLPPALREALAAAVARITSYNVCYTKLLRLRRC